MAAPGIRLHIVSGKGGTGKTTVAGALALSLATAGQRVLLVEVEGRQGLAQLFDTPPLPATEMRLAASRGGELIGLAVDPETAMLEYLEMFYNIKRTGSVLRRMGATDFVTTIAPGLRDVLLTGKIKESVIRKGKDGHHIFDAVVVDAPPTGRIVSFLDATREVAELTKMGPIFKHSAGVADMLRTPETAVHLVTLLEEMPVQETLDAIRQLEAAGYRPGRIIVNRARPELVPAGLGSEALAEGLQLAGLPAKLLGALSGQLDDYAARQGVQVEASADLLAAGLPIIRLPELTPPIDMGGLYELADELSETDWKTA
jgi:anion-transporting  ArsA/GET3 family ATPase